MTAVRRRGRIGGPKEDAPDGESAAGLMGLPIPISRPPVRGGHRLARPAAPVCRTFPVSTQVGVDWPSVRAQMTSSYQPSTFVQLAGIAPPS